MNRSQSQVDQDRMDTALRDALGNLERPSLSVGFDRRLEQLSKRSHTVAAGRSVRWTMRIYWAVTSLVSLGILLALGSPSPTATWTILAALMAALLMGTAPQFLFRTSHRSSLVDLIVDSVR